MKRLSLLALAAILLGVLNTQAREIGLDEALQTAKSFATTQGARMSAAPLKLVSQASTATGVAYYVFAPESGSGYTIVSGNDVAEPILGFSENGKFDLNNMPENMRFMLDYYRSEIEHAVATGYTPNPTPAKRSMNMVNIEPLCKTTWDQEAPYWNLCPTKSGSRCYTGCVATAMAQAAYVYKYPAQSKGSAVWNNTTVTFNRTYDWDNMLLSYSGSYTSAQGTAVAELMVDMGKSVDMDYGNYWDGGSGANTDMVPGALVNNFSYDKACAYSQASDWSIEAWNELMYYQLMNGWPVIYGGFGTGYNGGHQFMCDGYRVGDYFHINWGWSGMSDGYFKLTALRPGSQGAGGNTSDFSTGCDAVYFFRPPVEGSEMQTEVTCRGNFTMSASTSNGTTFRVTNGKIWTQTCNGFINVGGFSFTATMGVRLINVDDPSKAYTVSSGTQTTFNKWSNILSTFTVKLNDIPDGTYYCFPVSKASTKDYWERCPTPRDRQAYCQLSINGGDVISMTPTSPLYNPVTNLYMASLDSVKKNDILHLNPVVIPSNATNTALRFRSTNPNIAKVDSITGVVVGVEPGTCEIYATTTDGSMITVKTTMIVKDNGAVGEITDMDANAEVDVYTITGILVRRAMPLTEIQNLPSGIYIAGGKKYYVR